MAVVYCIGCKKYCIGEPSELAATCRLIRTHEADRLEILRNDMRRMGIELDSLYLKSVKEDLDQ